MKVILKLFLIGTVCVTLKADILRLRDGRMITGQFLGATRTEIWFKGETPGDILGAAAYRVEEVESLTFGPAPKQSKVGAVKNRGRKAAWIFTPAAAHRPDPPSPPVAPEPPPRATPSR